MRRFDPQQIAGVISPAQSADERRAGGNHKFLRVGVQVGSLDTELSEEPVHVINLEVDDMNRLLAQFGIQATNLYTDAKKLVIPAGTPLIGGLRWAYYTGNLLRVESSHSAKQIGRASCRERV